jgi:hypothetical protein
MVVAVARHCVTLFFVTQAIKKRNKTYVLPLA